MQMYQITTVSHTAISGFENIDLPGIHQLVEEDESNYFFFLMEAITFFAALAENLSQTLLKNK